MEQAVHDEGVTSSVLMLGVREDINELYSMLDTFFMPSLYEGLPVSCVEAQATGLHCVYSTDVPRESDITGTGILSTSLHIMKLGAMHLKRCTSGIALHRTLNFWH